MILAWASPFKCVCTDESVNQKVKSENYCA